MKDFLSIDTEGHDGKVILGMVKTLRDDLYGFLNLNFTIILLGKQW
jgi:hypothetical protein